MTYSFKTQYAQQLYSHVSTIVPVAFKRDDEMLERGAMDFNEKTQKVEVRYHRNADEIRDLTHELLHIRMQFEDGFPLLSWTNDHPSLTPAIKDLVKRIRDVVDDTYILHHLYKNTGVLPISQVFYSEVRKDLKRRVIRNLQGVLIESQPLVVAWRLRLADLSCSEYRSVLTPNQKALSTDFLSQFQTRHPDAEDLLNHLRQNIVGAIFTSPGAIGKALIGLRDKVGLPAWLHLATRQMINGRWVLKQ